jgi:SIR2-like domain
MAADLLAEAVFTLPASSRQGARQPAHAWDQLIRNLESGECVPFLGAGACDGHIPLAATMARTWGDAASYPLYDKANLPRVMQYIATTEYDGDATSLKRDFIAREFAAAPPPDFGGTGQVHGLLARFDLPLYATTNYDDFMYLALQQSRRRPRRDHSLWYAESADGSDSPLSDLSYEPSPAEPLVFHLHGRYQVPESIVLTEDDYIEYLVQLARDTHRQAGLVSGLLPAYVHGQLRSKPLLFIGYSLRDWTFLVLFRTLLHGIPDTHRRNHVSVQIDPNERSARRAREYLERYLHAQRIQVFWNSASEFATELDRRLGGASS